MKNWGLYINGELADPFIYASGKTQADVITDTLKLFKTFDIVFIHGAVGSGKSVVAVTLGGLMGRGIIAVPTKILQNQYVEDYQGDIKIIFDNKEIEIGMLLGRDNFPCPHMGGDTRCSSPKLVCTKSLNGQTRTEVAKECVYWNPVFHSLLDFEDLKNIYVYASHSGITYFHKRGDGCGYYDQYIHFVKANCCVMNSAKWEIETILKRKPKVGLEIIDEADAWLDGLTLHNTINKYFFNRFLDIAEHGRDRSLYEDINNIFMQFKNIPDELQEYEPYAPYLLKEFPQIVKLLTALGGICTNSSNDQLRNYGLKLARIENYLNVVHQEYF